MYVGLSLLCPTVPFHKVLWSMFMHIADGIDTGFCGSEAVSTFSLQNVFPEIAQHADSIRLLAFEKAKSK